MQRFVQQLRVIDPRAARDGSRGGDAGPAVFPWEHRPACVAVVALCCVASTLAGMLSRRSAVTGMFATVLPIGWLQGSGAVGLALLPVEWLLDCIIAPTMGELVLLIGSALLAGSEVERALGSLRTLVLLSMVALVRLPLCFAVNSVMPSMTSWWVTPPSVAWIGITLCVARRLMTCTPQRPFEVRGVVLSEQALGDILALQAGAASAQPIVLLVTVIATALTLSESAALPSLSHTVESRLPHRVKRALAVAGAAPKVAFFPFPSEVPRRASAPPAGTAAAVAVGAQPDARRSVVNDSDVAILRELGFSEEQSRTALLRAGGNVNIASGMLLDGEIPIQT